MINKQEASEIIQQLREAKITVAHQVERLKSILPKPIHQHDHLAVYLSLLEAQNAMNDIQKAILQLGQIKVIKRT